MSSSKNAIDMTLQQLDVWYQSPLGSYVLEMERAELDKYLPHYYGDHFLQLGGPSETFLFERSPIAHRVRLSPESFPVFSGPSVCGQFHAMPFMSETIDVLLLPHVLELIDRPADFLAECYRVLSPEGRLIILGFNPSSLWGIRRYLGTKKTFPWCIHFKLKAYIKHLLQVQNLSIEHISNLLFEPPVKNTNGLKKLFPMEALGRVFWSDFGAIYLIIAYKQLFSPIMLEASGSSC
jgi:SAM-dependent methyltransferase